MRLASFVSGQGEGADIDRISDKPRGCRRFAIFALLAAVGCGDERPAEPPPPGPIPVAITRRVAPVPATVWPSRYYEGYVAEVVRGDLVTARAAYRDVLDGADTVDSTLAARAALRLASLDMAVGRPREAAELAARARALGDADRDVVERAEQLRDALAATAGGNDDRLVRGPDIGVELAGVSPEIEAQFREAETLHRAFFRVRVAPRIEDPQAGARARLRAAEAAVRAYRAAGDRGGATAAAAAQMRIGAVYHDYAILLVSEAPPELEARAQARLRAQQRRKAIKYLRLAREAYRRAVAAASEPASPWRVAALEGINSVEDLMRFR